MNHSGRALAALLLAVHAIIAGCSVGGPQPSSDLVITFLPPAQARDLPADRPFAEGRPGENGETILRPVSVGVDDGASYRFSLGHCGLLSPVDVDGAFWDPVDAVDGAGRVIDLRTDDEMINQTAGVIIVIGDEALFRTEGGATVRFDRHAGEKAFPGCD